MDIIDRIFADFRRSGDLDYRERVSQREHSLQTALFAERDGADELMIAAALLHDYGHLIHGLPEDIAQQGIDGEHEAIGAAALEPHFPPEVTVPIRLHVPAKRYLCTTDPAYLEGLSPTSVLSLELQGGTFSEAGARAFEANPYFERAVQLRRYDDLGKVEGMETPDLEHFRPCLEAALRTSG